MNSIIWLIIAVVIIQQGDAYKVKVGTVTTLGSTIANSTTNKDTYSPTSLSLSEDISAASIKIKFMDLFYDVGEVTGDLCDTDVSSPWGTYTNGLFQSLGLDPEDGCPIPAGDYTFVQEFEVGGNAVDEFMCQDTMYLSAMGYLSGDNDESLFQLTLSFYPNEGTTYNSCNDE